MLGAIAGDIIGSVFEGSGLKIKEFPLLSAKNVYTDDTVLTVAIAAAILDERDYANSLRKFARRHPGRGYGGIFISGSMMTRWVRTIAGAMAPLCGFLRWGGRLIL